MASRPETLLDVLRSRSAVDCDTLDASVAAELGPFVDCTSNQAIAYHELIRVDDASGRPVHEQLIRDAVAFAASRAPSFPGVPREELAVEVMMVALALRVVPHLTGYSHVQTNPKHSYDKQKTIENGQRIVAIFKALDPAYDTGRVCIKIPATWEGMQACRELEAQGIATLATTMFCMAQAALASHVGCTYIAPYINELRVHFDPSFVDENKAFDFAGAAQRHYEGAGSRTRVLPASLTSAREVMRLAGVHHITVSPPLLRELAETPAGAGPSWEGDNNTGSVFSSSSPADGDPAPGEGGDFVGGGGGTAGAGAGVLDSEAAWRMAFTRSMGGKAEAKIIQAINIFSEKQEGLEGLAARS